MQNLKVYKVLSSLKHDGKNYGPGIEGADTVELTTDQARPLEKLNVVVVSEAQAEASEPADPPMSDEDRAALIFEATAMLDPDKDFTNGGNPKVKVLSEALGFEVTAEEVKMAWAGYSANRKDGE
jgi:hypothetical protein